MSETLLQFSEELSLAASYLNLRSSQLFIYLGPYTALFQFFKIKVIGYHFNFFVDFIVSYVTHVAQVYSINYVLCRPSVRRILQEFAGGALNPPANPGDQWNDGIK